MKSNLNGVTVCLANEKGGCGKSTTAVHLAHAWARQGQGVSVHDLDKNRSALAYSASLPEIEWRGMEEPIEANDSCCTVVDTPPGLDRALKEALEAADVVLVPVNNWDAAKGLSRLLETLQRAKVHNSGLRWWLVGTMAKEDTEHWRDTESTLRERFGAQFCESVVPYSTMFEKASTAGMTMFDLRPRHAATLRFQALAEEVRAKITNS